MTNPDLIDRQDRPALTVIAGLTYIEPSQVFNRWFLPVYRTSFRWTGNRADAEDATTWVFMRAMDRVRLPERVNVADDYFAEATLEAASRHWSERYGVARPRCSEIWACETSLSIQPALTLEALVDGLSAEMRLMIVLRFLRRRTLSAIVAQLGVSHETANLRLFTALSGVAERIGLHADPSRPDQADHVAAFVDDLARRRRPVRFEATPGAWVALLAAAHVQAAVAGNNLPRARFVRALEQTFETNRFRRRVTHLRIWTA